MFRLPMFSLFVLFAISSPGKVRADMGRLEQLVRDYSVELDAVEAEVREYAELMKPRYENTREILAQVPADENFRKCMHGSLFRFGKRRAAYCDRLWNDRLWWVGMEPADPEPMLERVAGHLATMQGIEQTSELRERLEGSQYFQMLFAGFQFGASLRPMVYQMGLSGILIHCSSGKAWRQLECFLPRFDEFLQKRESSAVESSAGLAASVTELKTRVLKDLATLK